MAGLDSFSDIPSWGKILILVGVLVIISAGFYVALYMSVSDQITEAEGQQERLKREIQEAKRREEQYLQLTQELADREVVDRHNKKILPEEAEIPAFLQDLDRVAELSGLQIRLVEPRPEEVQEFFARIPVGLAFTGRFHQLSKFFYNISRLDRAISLENIQLDTPRELANGELVLDASVLATTYRRAPEDAGGGAQKQGGT